MSRFIVLLLVAGALVVGCQPAPTTAETPAPETANPAPVAGGGSGDDIAPMTPSSGAIPNAPVSGGQNLGSGSGGFGTGMAAKDAARRKTANAGSGSLSQMPEDE